MPILSDDNCDDNKPQLSALRVAVWTALTHTYLIY